MKSRRETTRHYHMRRVKSGIVPVRQHLMMYWKTMFPDKPRGYKPSPAIIRQNMVRLLYQPQKDAKRTEMLTIVVPKTKEKYYKFLEAYTKFPARGKWKQFDEANSVLEVQFQETPDDRIGKSLITLIGLYNRVVVGEQVPYAYTKHIDDSTLIQDLDKDGVPDYADCDPLDPTKQDTPLYAMARRREENSPEAVAKGLGMGEGKPIGGAVPPSTPKIESPIIPPKLTQVEEAKKLAKTVAEGAKKTYEFAKKEVPKVKAEVKEAQKKAVEAKARVGAIAKGIVAEERKIEAGMTAYQQRQLEREELKARTLESQVRQKELKQQLRELRKKKVQPELMPEAPAVSAPRRSRAQRRLEKLQTKLETERVKAELRELKEAQKKPKRARQVQAPVSEEGIAPEATAPVAMPKKRRRRRKSKKFTGIFGIKI